MGSTRQKSACVRQSFSWPGEIFVAALEPVETRGLSADALPSLIEELRGAIDRSYHALRAELRLPALERARDEVPADGAEPARGDAPEGGAR